MSQLQDILDEMKGKKLTSFTPFGKLNQIKNKHLNADNPYIFKTPIAVKNFDQLGERFQYYAQFVSKLMTVKELLGELSDSFAGEHDCKLSPDSGCTHQSHPQI